MKTGWMYLAKAGSMAGRLPSWLVFFLVFGGLVAWNLGSPDHPPINPEIYPAFESIVTLCASLDAGTSGKPCRDVRNLVNYCTTRAKSNCSLIGFYQVLAESGFKLPPLYTVRPESTVK